MSGASVILSLGLSLFYANKCIYNHLGFLKDGFCFCASGSLPVPGFDGGSSGSSPPVPIDQARKRVSSWPTLALIHTTFKTDSGIPIV